MAAVTQVLFIKKLSGKNIIRSAARHNLREIQAERGADSHINTSRIPLNIVMAGSSTADGVAAQAERLMNEANIRTLRRDAVRALEILVSLPSTTTVHQAIFFADVLEWAEEYYALPVLSAVVHNDETTPHCHILLLPLHDGHMRGSAAMGNAKRLHAMHTNFYEQVGIKFGLRRPKKPQRLNTATRKKAASLVLTTLQDNPSLMDRPEIGAALLTSFAHDPCPMLDALGLEVPHPQKATRSFVEIMTQPVKPEKQEVTIGDFIRRPIDHDSPKVDQTLSCVGFARITPSNSSAELLHSCAGTHLQHLSSAANEAAFSAQMHKENVEPNVKPYLFMHADYNRELRATVPQDTLAASHLRTA